MIQQIETRLKELKGEFENGQKMLAELEARQANVKSTLLRISGAIQALEELLSPAKPMVKTARALQRSRTCALRPDHGIPGER